MTIVNNIDARKNESVVHVAELQTPNVQRFKYLMGVSASDMLDTSIYTEWHN